MRKTYNFNTPRDYFKLKRTTQITESHCGPATIQMLLSNVGVDVTQDKVAEAGDATELIERNGMRVDQLARAVVLLASEVEFWYKMHAELSDLIALITEHQYPVGVEWQGIFDDDEEDTSDDNDYGHYSLISHIDIEKQALIVVDPYKDFVSRDRILSFDEFVERWWDYNEVMNIETGKPELVKDTHLMFIVTPKDVTFPEQLGMVRA
jgi:hypothetical protein